MYSLIRKILFSLDEERSHELALKSLDAAYALKCLPLLGRVPDAQPVECMGLTFPNRVGLAAGLDKNGDHFNALGALGFGFVEIGTVTPKAQPGNDKPRLFRLPEAEAIINRMGFNNQGLDYLLSNVARRRYSGVLGINVGKNLTTPVADALSDYRCGIESVYTVADYISVNISSPNTPGLRDLQFGDNLKRLLAAVKECQLTQQKQHSRYVPIAVKIAPDMTDDELSETAIIIRDSGLDAVIATNTTVDRGGVEALKNGAEAGGLSGRPLMLSSTRAIEVLAQSLAGTLPIIGVGGIMSGQDAKAKLQAGATLVQIYSGFIYRGPPLVKECIESTR